MKKLDTIIITIGIVALASGLALEIIWGAKKEWVFGCFLLAGLSLLGEALFYILSIVQLRREVTTTGRDIKRHNKAEMAPPRKPSD